MHHEVPTVAKLWSPLRQPLNAFFCCHAAAVVTYFLDARRLFSQRQDYFWLLHDLALHATGAPLLDALCASEPLWVQLLEQTISELPEDGATPCPIQCFETLHLMASIVEVRPRWLHEHPALMKKVQALWEHPGRPARTQQLRQHGVHERMETAMLAKLVLSFVDVRASALPFLLDLFSMFQYPVRPLPSIPLPARACAPPTRSFGTFFPSCQGHSCGATFACSRSRLHRRNRRKGAGVHQQELPR